MMVPRDVYMLAREQTLVRDQLAHNFHSLMQNQFDTQGSAGLYGFLLSVLDEFGTDDEMTVEKFMDRAVKVFRENFPPIGENQEAA